MVRLAAERWTPFGVRIEQGEVIDWLAGHSDRYDAVYSVFGAAWFADPSRLFPLVRARLADGGRFVFSQPPAIPGAYGPQGMYKGGFAGRAQFTYRYSYRPAVWERLLLRAGFTTAEAAVLDAPRPGHIGTLIVTAVAGVDRAEEAADEVLVREAGAVLAEGGPAVSLAELVRDLFPRQLPVGEVRRRCVPRPRRRCRPGCRVRSPRPRGRPCVP